MVVFTLNVYLFRMSVNYSLWWCSRYLPNSGLFLQYHALPEMAQVCRCYFWFWTDHLVLTEAG